MTGPPRVPSPIRGPGDHSPEPPNSPSVPARLVATSRQPAGRLQSRHRSSSSRRAAESVLAQIQQIDSRLSHAIEAYNLANVKLDRIEGDVERNKRDLGVAKQNLGIAQNRLADRVVSLYTSGEDNSALGVLLGA